MLMKKLIPIFIFLFITNFLFAQKDDHEYATDEEVEEFEGLKEDKKKIDLSNFVVGGDLGLGFASNTFYAEFSPTIGYQIIKNRLEFGPGLIYQHQSEAKQYAVNSIGGQAYVRAYVFDGFFAQVDGFLVNYNFNNLVLKKKSSFSYGNGFVGVGYALNHKEAPFYLVISLKTNMVVNKYYPKRLLIPKIGFQFKL